MMSMLFSGVLKVTLQHSTEQLKVTLQHSTEQLKFTLQHSTEHLKVTLQHSTEQHQQNRNQPEQHTRQTPDSAKRIRSNYQHNRNNR
jgi:hypothetical protein